MGLSCKLFLFPIHWKECSWASWATIWNNLPKLGVTIYWRRMGSPLLNGTHPFHRSHTPRDHLSSCPMCQRAPVPLSTASGIFIWKEHQQVIIIIFKFILIFICIFIFTTIIIIMIIILQSASPKWLSTKEQHKPVETGSFQHTQNPIVEGTPIDC